MNSAIENYPNVKNSNVQTFAHETGINFFSFGTQKVQVVTINGNPYFVASDVCHILGLQNPTERLKTVLEDDEYFPYVVHRGRGNRNANIVNESGLYALIFQSRKPIAKAFRKWVTSEVLPAIRKTGAYVAPTAITYPAAMQPTNCAVLTCHTSDGGTKQVYLMYDDSVWFQCPKNHFDRHNVMQAMTHAIAMHDVDTFAYETDLYYLRDGKYTKCQINFPTHVKTKQKQQKRENAITNCQNAIEQYNRAKEDVKASAQGMIDYLNNNPL